MSGRRKTLEAIAKTHERHVFRSGERDREATAAKRADIDFGDCFVVNSMRDNAKRHSGRSVGGPLGEAFPNWPRNIDVSAA